MTIPGPLILQEDKPGRMLKSSGWSGWLAME
jgi:hypothetical protein